VSERGLKRLAIHAKRAFDDEVKAGTRAPLSTDELEITEAEREALDEAKGKRNKQKGRPTGVKQAKIVRQADRADPLTGKGRSKGYGFIEMDTHADALRVLRWSNNNREAHKLLWAWWREEVVDLAQAGKEQLKALATSGDTSKSAPRDITSGKEDLETRVKKLEARAAEMKTRDSEGPTKDGRTLLVEFSVENITVVKRRREKEAMPSGDINRFPIKVWPDSLVCGPPTDVLSPNAFCPTSRSGRHRPIRILQHQSAPRKNPNWTNRRGMPLHRGINRARRVVLRRSAPPLAALSGKNAEQGNSELEASRFAK